MKALTVKAPWAQAIVHGTKRIENRTWKPHADVLSERIAIHCGLTTASPNTHGLKGVKSQLEMARAEVVNTVFGRGCIIGTAKVVGWYDVFRGTGDYVEPSPVDWVDMVGIVDGYPEVVQDISTVADDPWWLGPIGWLLDDVRAVEPVAVRGQVGLWTVPDEIKLIEVEQ